MTANDDIRDAALRHQVHVRRFASGEVNRMLDLLEKADRDLVRLIRKEVKKVQDAAGDPGDSRNLRRLQGALDEIRRERERLLKAIEGEVDANLIAFGEIEADFEAQVLQQNIPVKIKTPTVTPTMIRELARTQPFAGRALGDWWEGLRNADQQRVLDQIRIGHLEGQGLPEIVSRIAGTRAGRFRDGVLAVTRRQAEAIVRTGVNGFSNAVRLETWQRADGLIDGSVWSSTLDGRTSAICRARDGKVRALDGGRPLPNNLSAEPLTPPFATPPAHPNCRSALIPWVSTIGLIGDRPFVRDTRNRRRREMDFRGRAREKAGSEWKGLSEKERRRRIRAERDAWGDANIGRVPSATTYDAFLRRQPAAFQDDVLGKTRGKLFRKGGLKQDQFVDFNGDTLTLDQLRALHPGAFAKAGIE